MILIDRFLTRSKVMEIILQFAAGNLDRIVQNIKYPAIRQFEQCCVISLNGNVQTTLQ